MDYQLTHALVSCYGLPMDIRCGNCKERHSTIREVRECHWGDFEQQEIMEADLRAEAAHERAIERSHEWAAS